MPFHRPDSCALTWTSTKTQPDNHWSHFSHLIVALQNLNNILCDGMLSTARCDNICYVISLRVFFFLLVLSLDFAKIPSRTFNFLRRSVSREPAREGSPSVSGYASGKKLILASYLCKFPYLGHLLLCVLLLVPTHRQYRPIDTLILYRKKAEIALGSISGWRLHYNWSLHHR